MRLCRHDGRGAENKSCLFKEVADLPRYCSRHPGVCRHRPVNEGFINSAVVAACNRRPRCRHLHDWLSEDLRVPELQCSARRKVNPTHPRIVCQLFLSTANIGGDTPP